ncbi:hypothetical protein CS379_24195, partial [Methylobacterium frigidaeris]
RNEFDAQFRATEQSTDFQYDKATLANINDTVFAAVSAMDADDYATKSAVDHAFEAAVSAL